MNEVDHPKHYQRGGIETIDYIRATLTDEQFEGYCVGNALKYLSRYKDKGGVTDLRKAYVYLGWAIEPRPVPTTGRNAPLYDPGEVKFRNTENFTAWNGTQSVAAAGEFSTGGVTSGDSTSGVNRFKVGDRVVVARPTSDEQGFSGRVGLISEMISEDLSTVEGDGWKYDIWASSLDRAPDASAHPMAAEALREADEHPGNLDDLRRERSGRNEGMLGRFGETFGIGEPQPRAAFGTERD